MAISTTILHDLRDALSGPKRQGTTFADDTLCQWMIDTQEDVAQLDSFLGRVLEVMGHLGLLVNLAKTALLLKVRGPGARRALKPYIVQREGRKHWRISNAKGEALVPLATSVVYLGTHLTLEGGGKAVVQHRLAEARDREAKIKRTVQARRLLGLQHRIRIWQTCSVTSALFGIHPIGLSSTGAVALRQWFHRQLRAITNEPAHINHIGNSTLREKYGVQDPVDNLHTAASRKLEKLRAAEPDITNPPAMIGYWEGICEQLRALTTTRTSSLSPVTAPIWEEGVPCDVCGLYFSSTKTMRQHRARKHQVLVQVNPKEEAQYQPHEHSLNGLPQCKHCNLKLSSADALKQHVLTYACRPRKAVDQGARGDAEPTARNNAERRTAEETVTPPLSTGSPPHRPQHDAAPEETAPGPDLPLLRSREASAYLRQEQVPLQVLTGWAPKLLQHCGFCNHWVAQGGSVKEHIKRMHQCIWDAALERFDDCCLAYESLILRDHPCELCHQTVYTKARHLRNCVVLAQVSIAQAWVKAGAPEANEVCSVSPSDFNEATAKRLLWGGPEECSQGDTPLLRYLERQCVSCGQQLTNQQDWRRHVRKVHKQTWEEAERHLSGTASRVQFVRPCKFCRVHFTKTPQLHSQKCLPLLQLAYIQHHGRSVGPEGGGKTVGHDLANGTHVGRRAGQGSASQVPQNQGAVWAASGKKGLGAEIGPNPGASSTTPDDGEDHCPTRGSPAALGGGSQLDPVHGGRRARHHTTTDADDCDVEEIPHARHMQVRAEASANGGSTHAASGQAAKAGSRCSGPAEALKGQAPQHGAPGVALREVEPGQAMSRAHRGRTSPARQRHQVHASTHGAHGKGRGDTRISCARWDGSGQRQDQNVQTHAVDGGAKEAADPGSAHCPFRLGSPEAHRSETETRKISPSAAQGAPGNDPGRRAVSAGSQRGEPSSATNGSIAAPHTELRQTIFTLGRVKQIESLPPGLSQKDLRRVDVKKGKPKSGPSRSGKAQTRSPRLALGETSPPSRAGWFNQSPVGTGKMIGKEVLPSQMLLGKRNLCLT